nr:hypothetical protein BaRGS_008212 [Batillaria attramentaria]
MPGQRHILTTVIISPVILTVISPFILTVISRVIVRRILPKVPGILDGLVYVCYVPFLFSGPPMPFYQFLTEMESPRKLTGRRLADITWCFLRIVFWFFFNHAMLHLVFFSTLAQTPPLFQAMDRWTLLGTAWLLGQFMTNKYFVIYGLPSQIARLDGFWHGGEPNLQAWAVLNFVEVNLEKLGAVLEKWSVAQDLLLKRLSPQADARLRGALCVILFYVGTTSNMFFLGGSAFAMHYAIKWVSQLGPTLLIFVCFYSLIQVSRHLERLGCTKY